MRSAWVAGALVCLMGLGCGGVRTHHTLQGWDSALATQMERHRVPGVSVAIIDEYRIADARGYGILEEGSDRKVGVRTLFQAASISKPITALAALSLAEAGEIELDAAVNDYLVSWRLPENQLTAIRPVTLRMLLSHGAGVTVGGFPGYAEWEEIPTLVEVLDGKGPANTPPIRVDLEPGSEVRYSGGGYCVVQQAISDVTGQPFSQLMEEIVLAPLEMNASGFALPLPEELRGDAASCHWSNGAPVEGGWHSYPEQAAAGLWTTPTDLARFAIELMRCWKGESERVISPEMAREMLTAQHEASYGLGIVVLQEGQEAFRVMHNGANAGCRCLLVAYPERGKGAVIMTNSDNGDRIFDAVLSAIADEYEWPDHRSEA